jgi:hypothetical protein
MRTRRGIGLALLLVAAPATASETSEAVLLERIDQLERRIRDLEANQPTAPDASGSAGWTRHVRLGGSADVGYFGGQENSLFDTDSFLVWDARLFVDASLAENVELAERTVFRNVALTFEWDLVRLGDLDNRVGELYADFQGLLGQDALNLQLGRFQIPVGEAYLLYSQGYAYRPFVSNPVGGPWWWDEGVRIYGTSPEKTFGFVSSIADGETPFNTDASGDEQVTLKLIWQPWQWLHLSVSGLRSGQLGSASTPASGALWLGETWARPLGAGSSVPSYQGGVEVADGPNRYRDTWLAAGDAIFDFEDKARVWLAYGRYTMNAKGSSAYDRVLHYWIAETLLRGAWISETLRPFYLGLRANALGTYDADEGYLLDSRRRSTLGYNMQSLTAYSAVLGWELSQNLRLRAEYTHGDIDLVRGVSQALRDAAGDTDAFAVEVGASF